MFNRRQFLIRTLQGSSLLAVGSVVPQFLVNTARAQLHDTDALVAALQSGKVSAAGLDHFVGEHLPVDRVLARPTAQARLVGRRSGWL